MDSSLFPDVAQLLFSFAQLSDDNTNRRIVPFWEKLKLAVLLHRHFSGFGFANILPISRSSNEPAEEGMYPLARCSDNRAFKIYLAVKCHQNLNCLYAIIVWGKNGAFVH
jgi:hypothetical protein